MPLDYPIKPLDIYDIDPGCKCSQTASIKLDQSTLIKTYNTGKYERLPRLCLVLQRLEGDSHDAGWNTLLSGASWAGWFSFMVRQWQLPTGRGPGSGGQH